MREQRQEFVLSEEFDVKVVMHQGSVPSIFFVVVVGVVTELLRNCVLCELLMSEMIERLINKFLK